MERSRLVAPVAAAGLQLMVTGVGSAIARVPTFSACRHVQHLSAPVAPARGVPPFSISGLRVSRMTCARAASAVRAGSFAEDPAGLLFTTPRFTCQSPIGPPLPGQPTPRPYTCQRGAARFRFVVPGSD
jgi:hypothetical protein